MTTSTFGRLAPRFLAVAVGATVLVTSASTASAVTQLKVNYTAKGTTLVAKTNSTVILGPATLKSAINPDGTFTAALKLPKTSTTFTVGGLIPASADVTFYQYGPLKGRLQSAAGITTITANANYVVNLSNVVVGGVPAMVGTTCQTIAPVNLPAATPAGQSFNIFTGGSLTGTYTIGDFANCGVSTTLINQLVPGPNNTITFVLSNGRAASS